jgi:hypothetical protein
VRPDDADDGQGGAPARPIAGGARGERSVVAVTGPGARPRHASAPGPDDAGPFAAAAALAERFGAGDPVTLLVVGPPLRAEPLPFGRRGTRRVLAAPTAAELVRLWSGWAP